MTAPFSFTFDWRPGEHAHVTGLLIREQFSSGVWRLLKWTLVLVLVLSAAMTMATAAAGDLTSTLQLGPLTLIVSGLAWKFPILSGRVQAWRVQRSDPNVYATDRLIDRISAKRPEEPICRGNLGHPANSRLALAKATRSHIHVFGIDWDDESGLTNGQFAPFDWQGP